MNQYYYFLKNFSNFANVAGDTLTVTIDEDGDILIDQTIVFQRQ